MILDPYSIHAFLHTPLLHRPLTRNMSPMSLPARLDQSDCMNSKRPKMSSKIVQTRSVGSIYQRRQKKKIGQ